MMQADWPNQTYAVAECERMMAQGFKNLCVTSPTGGGKSRIIQRLIENAVARGQQVAVLTNRKLLTAQLSRGLTEGGIHVGVRAADFESWEDHTAPVQVCSIPTEAARVLKRRKNDMDRFVSQEQAEKNHSLFPAQLVIVDEVHMNSGDRASAILGEYEQKHQATRIGVTATPLGVSHLYDNLIVAGNNEQLRGYGALVEARSYEPAVMDIWKVRRTKEEYFTQAQLDKQAIKLWTQHVVGHIWSSWIDLNPMAKPALVMAPGVHESRGLAEYFWHRGVNAAHIDGESIYVDGTHYRTTAQEDRDELFARMKSGEVPITMNRFVLREAIDLPFLEHLILCTPIASVLSYVQVVGRVLRASWATGKTDALVVDHANNIRQHGDPNMNRDDDWRRYFFEHEAKIDRDRNERLRDPHQKEPEPITCPQCGKMRDSGYKCPGCGFEHSLSTRRIIQESGELVPMKSSPFPKRRYRLKPDTIDKWIKVYHRMKRSRNQKSFRQAFALFKHENYYDLPRTLPYMPKDPRDFARKVCDVPLKDLIPVGVQ